jgi:hypothetical protein
MTTYAGGTQVRGGYYINGRTFEFANVQKDGGALPGGPDARWLRIPVLAVMAAAPALGGLFVISLPLVTVGFVAYTLVRKATGGARSGAKEVGATLAPPWAPGEAHLTGEPDGEKGAGGAQAPTPNARMDALEKEIRERRGK